MWDATPMPLPLDAYIDTWHGNEAVRWIAEYERPEPFYLFVGFPGPHDPWDAPQAAVDRYRDAEISMPHSTRRPTLEGTGRYEHLLRSFLWLSDTETMTDDAIRGMRRAYSADVSVIDDAVARIVAALEARRLLDDTWLIYTSDHGEMGGNHGLMSKCVMYEPAVRVPLIVRPPRGCAPRIVGSLVEHVDVPATVRLSCTDLLHGGRAQRAVLSERQPLPCAAANTAHRRTAGPPSRPEPTQRTRGSNRSPVHSRLAPRTGRSRW